MEDSILKKIYGSALKFLTPLSSEETYATIVKEAIRLVNASYGSLVLEDGGSFVDAYSTSPRENRRRKKGFTFKAFKENKAYVLHRNKFGKIYPDLPQLGIESIIFIPLAYKNKPFGVLVVNSTKKEVLTEKELEILQLFGSLASMAVKKSQLYDEAKRALEIRDSFIPLAAHELRTPLTSISGYIQLLNAKMGKDSSIESKWTSDLMIESRRLINLISELLEINRINAGRLDIALRECRMSEIVDASIKKFDIGIGSRIKLKSIVTNGEDKIVGDSEKLSKAIYGLLDNAIKFSRSESEVLVLLKSDKRNVKVIISDMGKGIDKKELTKIFESFYKGEVDAQKGLGLGLFLAQKILEKHNGDIKIKSKLGKGTKVEVYLPRAKYD